MPACAVCGYQAAEAFKFCPECGAAAAARTSEQRKVVTVLFCDVVGSTALGDSREPEALGTLFARYFERMKAIGEGTDLLSAQGDACADLAKLLALGGSP